MANFPHERWSSFERRSKYDVDDSTFAHLLRLAEEVKGSFLRAVDEVCSDGEVTDVERSYIDEQASRAGMTSQQDIENVLRRFLTINAFENRGVRDVFFAELVAALHIARFVIRDYRLEFQILRTVFDFLDWRATTQQVFLPSWMQRRFDNYAGGSRVH